MSRLNSELILDFVFFSPSALQDMGTTIMEEDTTRMEAMVTTVTADMVKIDFPQPPHNKSQLLPIRINNKSSLSKTDITLVIKNLLTQLCKRTTDDDAQFFGFSVWRMQAAKDSTAEVNSVGPAKLLGTSLTENVVMRSRRSGVHRRWL